MRWWIAVARIGHHDRPPSMDFTSLVLPGRQRYLAVDELHSVRVFAAYIEWTAQFDCDWCVCGLDVEYDSVYCLWHWACAFGIRWPWQELVGVLYFVVVSTSLWVGAAFDYRSTACEICVVWLRGHVCCAVVVASICLATVVFAAGMSLPLGCVRVIKCRETPLCRFLLD